MAVDVVPQKFKRASKLSPQEIAYARDLLKGKQPFSIYFNAAIHDASLGIDNRWFYFSPMGGLAMGIDFDGLRVFSTIGDVDDAIFSVMASNPFRTEFHVEPSQMVKFDDLGIKRLLRKDRLKYYLLEKDVPFNGLQGDLKRLRANDLEMVQQFYASHYDGAIFSAWMLELPFWGLFVNQELAAAGGAVVIDRLGKAANVGNFLTVPKFRGNGYGKTVAMALMNDLISDGLSVFTLGTTEENVAAWKTYENVGFRLLERRVEIEFSAT